MRSIIQQSVVLPATAEELFDMYLDPAAHGAFTGSEVRIGKEPGSEFRAFNGALWGTILSVARPRLIVQSWRSTGFDEGDADSTLILTFTPEGDQARIDLIHLDVPEQDYAGVTAGWPKFYWAPWRQHLERR
jgi:activator of HSP90 ATPase